MAGPYGSFDGYYDFAGAAAFAPGYLETDTIVHMVSNLYDLNQNKLIWSGTSQTFDPAFGEAVHERRVEGGGQVAGEGPLIILSAREITSHLQSIPPARRRLMATAKKPNILILCGDDIGIWNISHFSRGQMGYRTPNIDRVANEGVTFTDYYAQQSCTAGRAAFITGQNPDPHRPDEGRHAGRDRRAAGRRSDHRRVAEAAGLRHRPVRQEPPGRSRRVPADRARLRRVLRQPVSPERRGRAGAARLSQGSRRSRRSSDRAACFTAPPMARADRRSPTPAR